MQFSTVLKNEKWTILLGGWILSICILSLLSHASGSFGMTIITIIKRTKQNATNWFCFPKHIFSLQN